MGLFSKNWSKELERAESFLERDLPVPALEIAERAERKAEPDLRAQAAGIVLRARSALLTSVLAKAEAAEAAGDFEDAADWLLSAFEQESSEVRRSELKARRQALLDRQFESESPFVVQSESLTVTAEGELDTVDIDFEYETLVSMLKETVRSHYADRPVEFKQALVDLNQGRAAEALALFDRLVEEGVDDAFLDLERGRANLLIGEAGAARDHLEAAWETLGDDALDEHGQLLVPVLWAEAALAEGDPAAVADRLEALALPGEGHVDTCRCYAEALLAGGRKEEAAAYLERLTSRVRGSAELDLLLARTLASTGRAAEAIVGLEASLAPSCKAGGCSTSAVHLPSFRFAAQLQLGPSGDADRAREWIARVANAQGGLLGAEDHSILADYYEVSGDPEASRDAAAEAQRLEAAGSGAVSAVDFELGSGRQRVL